MDVRKLHFVLTYAFLPLAIEASCGLDNPGSRRDYENFKHHVPKNTYSDISLIPDEQRLLDYILRGYERSVRPVKNASSSVVIQMGLTLTQVLDMDEKNQVLITNVWLDQEWMDEFLMWDPSDFNNISKIRIPCHKIWLPDMVLYNNAAEYTDGLMPANAMVEPNGRVFWPVPTKLQSSCTVDVTYFPFDVQECHLKFGSWTYDGFQVDITNRSIEVDLSNYVKNGEWELVQVKCIRNVVYYPCCIEPFPDVTFYIKIRRRTLYYMYNVVFPCVMMSALTLLVFCLPPDSGEKIALGITVLLAFSVFMLAVAENLPETSEFVPLISIYLTIVMTLTSVSVIMTVFVLNLHHRGPDRQQVPPWLRRLFLGNSRSVSGSSSKVVTGNQHQHRQVHYSGVRNLDARCMVNNMTLKMTLENLAQELRDDLQLDSSIAEVDTNASNTCSISMPSPASFTTSDNGVDSITASSSPNNYKRGSNFRNNIVPTTPGSHGTPTHGQSPGRQGRSGKTPNPSGRKRPKPRTSAYEDALLSLTKLLDRHEIEEQEYGERQDWCRLAQTVDRILFVFFLFATVTSTLTVLVIIPATQDV